MGFRIETERLLLREWQDADFEPFRRIATDPEVMRYVSGGTPWTDEQIRGFLSRQRGFAAELGFCLAPLVLRDGGELVGQAGLQPLGTTRHIEIGWWLRPDCWGRGLASEAARALVGHGFGKAGLERIVAIAHPENRASIAIMEGLGMDFQRRHFGVELGLRDPAVEVVLYAIERDAPESR